MIPKMTLIIAKKIAEELAVDVRLVAAAIDLLNQGFEVPFIVNYRKEIIQSLTSNQLWLIKRYLNDFNELNKYREFILKDLVEQGKLTQLMEESILQATTKERLNDFYFSKKSKVNHLDTLQKHSGLELLANRLWKELSLDPVNAASEFLYSSEMNSSLDGNEEATKIEDILEGVRSILLTYIANDPWLIEALREHCWNYVVLSSAFVAEKKSKEKKSIENKFIDYASFAEKIKKISSQKALALFRGRREGVLHLHLSILDESAFAQKKIIEYFPIINEGHWLFDSISLVWKEQLVPKIERSLMARLQMLAQTEVTFLLLSSLRDCLLTSPRGKKIILGLCAGIVHDLELAVINEDGECLDAVTISPFSQNNEWHPSIIALAKLLSKYDVDVLAIASGSNSRELKRLVAELFMMYPDFKVERQIVNDLGVNEINDPALSIARRTQDALSELINLDLVSIMTKQAQKQYKQGLNRSYFLEKMNQIIKDCISMIGVNLNTASKKLLRYVPGLTDGLVDKIICYQKEQSLPLTKDTMKFLLNENENAFEQAIKFLRISEEKNQANDFESHGLFIKFNEDINDINKLTVGMILDGIVSNLAPFGLFVNIGVGQDGLVHSSELLHKNMVDLRDLFYVGDVVRVRVIEVDTARKRIGLSMKFSTKLPVLGFSKEEKNKKALIQTKPANVSKEEVSKDSRKLFNTTMANALEKLKEKWKE